MNIAQRVKDNMTGLAKLGRWSGGTTPTGYRSVTIENNNKKESYLELIPEMEDTIKSIFLGVAEGLTTFADGKKLGLSAKTVYNIVRNPVYVQSTEESATYLKHMGYTVYGELNGNGFIPYNRRPKKNGKKLFNSQGMFVTVSKHKAIIEPNLWIKANNNISSRGQEAKPRISTHSFLAHMVKCKCGSGMFVWQGKKDKQGNVVYYFMCSAKKQGSECNSFNIRVNEIEEMVLNKLIQISLDKNLLRESIESINKTTPFVLEPNGEKVWEIFLIPGMQLDSFHQVWGENAKYPFKGEYILKNDWETNENLFKTKVLKCDITYNNEYTESCEIDYNNILDGISTDGKLANGFFSIVMSLSHIQNELREIKTALSAEHDKKHS